jgi:RNA recognition motif-containing protein
MPVKLFVGGLSFTTSNESLRDAFARFGAVTSAIVMTDRATGRSRGFGFVEMATEDEANRAISGLNGHQLDGRMIRVDKATPRGAGPVRRPGGPPSGPRPGYGGGGGGGFAPRPPTGGFDARPSFGQDAGGRRGQGRDRGRPGESEQRKPGSGRRGGKPPGERRAGDKGRRSEEGYRW